MDMAASGHGRQARAFLRCSPRRNLRATILASVPWFLQDLGTYGIGIFTPTILAAAFGSKPDHVRSVSDFLILNDITRSERVPPSSTSADRRHAFRGYPRGPAGRIRAAGRWLYRLRGRFAVCFVLAVFDGSTKIAADFRRLHALQLHDQYRSERADLSAGRRGVPDGYPRHGRRFAAAFAKIGAVATAFLFPFLLTASARIRFSTACVTSLLGAVVTWVFRIETTGVSLDTLEHKS